MRRHAPWIGAVVLGIKQSLWRGFPAGLRRRALAIATGWLAPKSSPRIGSERRGIIVCGELTTASGSGETARLMAEAAKRLDLQVWTINLPPRANGGFDVELSGGSAPPRGVPLVLHVNAPMLPLALLRLPTAITRNRSFIGYWSWEVPEVPPEWRPGLACVNEVWVPSRFTATVLEPLLPGRVRVVPPPLAIVPPVASPLAREAFGLLEDAVVVLVSFSLASSFARKNPFAAVAAFRGAFGDRQDRILLLKISHPEQAPAEFARLVQMAHAPNIRIETRILSPEDHHALTACSDIVLSLHRGEGFGLVLAEAMLLGKPVIATGWSGNTDFMDSGNSALVGYRLIPAHDERSLYRGLWAEPDVTEAAALLHSLAEGPGLRRDLGERARISALARLDGKELLAALGDLA